LQKLYANEGKKKHQHHVCFTARAQDLQGLKKHLAKRNEARRRAEGNAGEGVWFRDPKRGTAS